MKLIVIVLCLLVAACGKAVSDTDMAKARVVYYYPQDLQLMQYLMNIGDRLDKLENLRGGLNLINIRQIAQNAGVTVTTSTEADGSGWINTVVTGTITPKSSTSTIVIVIYLQHELYSSTVTNNVFSNLRLVRDINAFTVEEFANTSAGNLQAAQDFRVHHVTAVITDSPSTLAAVTYRVQMQTSDSNSPDDWQVRCGSDAGNDIKWRMLMIEYE